MQLLGQKQMLPTFCKVREAQSCVDPSGEPQPAASVWVIKFERCGEPGGLGWRWPEHLSPGSPEHETPVWFASSVAALGTRLH